jgi:hypothetical protein
MFVLTVLMLYRRLSAACSYYLQRYAQTNIAVRYLRTRRGLKRALPAVLVLTPAYLLAAYAGTSAIERGGQG